MRFELFKDRNFVAGCLFMVVMGIVLFGTMALVTPFLQHVIGYPILSAGLLLAARGIGTLVAMLIVGRLLKMVEARYLVFTGLMLATMHAHRMSVSPTRLVADRSSSSSSCRASASAWYSCR